MIDALLWGLVILLMVSPLLLAIHLATPRAERRRGSHFDRTVIGQMQRAFVEGRLTVDQLEDGMTAAVLWEDRGRTDLATLDDPVATEEGIRALEAQAAERLTAYYRRPDGTRALRLHAAPANADHIAPRAGHVPRYQPNNAEPDREDRHGLANPTPLTRPPYDAR